MIQIVIESIFKKEFQLNIYSSLLNYYSYNFRTPIHFYKYYYNETNQSIIPLTKRGRILLRPLFVLYLLTIIHVAVFISWCRRSTMICLRCIRFRKTSNSQNSCKANKYHNYFFHFNVLPF